MIDNQVQLILLNASLLQAENKTKEYFPSFQFVCYPLEDNKYVRVCLKDDTAMMFNQIFEVNDSLVENVADRLEVVDWVAVESKIKERFGLANDDKDILACHCACYKFLQEFRKAVDR